MEKPRINGNDAYSVDITFDKYKALRRKQYALEKTLNYIDQEQEKTLQLMKDKLKRELTIDEINEVFLRGDSQIDVNEKILSLFESAVIEHITPKPDLPTSMIERRQIVRELYLYIMFYADGNIKNP